MNKDNKTRYEICYKCWQELCTSIVSPEVVSDSSVMKEEEVDVKSYRKKQNDEEDLTKHSANSGDI